MLESVATWSWNFTSWCCQQCAKRFSFVISCRFVARLPTKTVTAPASQDQKTTSCWGKLAQRSLVSDWIWICWEQLYLTQSLMSFSSVFLKLPLNKCRLPWEESSSFHYWEIVNLFGKNQFAIFLQALTVEISPTLSQAARPIKQIAPECRFLQ